MRDGWVAWLVETNPDHFEHWNLALRFTLDFQTKFHLNCSKIGSKSLGLFSAKVVGLGEVDLSFALL